MPDIIDVKIIKNRVLNITFSDGYYGQIDCDSFICSYTGVFEPLLNIEFFNQVYVNKDLGTIAWPNGADICPEYAYQYLINCKHTTSFEK
ncbi:MAG: hypothetical protein RL344_542 [Pseudomonadota bacterium]|jgi:hypothetical protein